MSSGGELCSGRSERPAWARPWQWCLDEREENGNSVRVSDICQISDPMGIVTSTIFYSSGIGTHFELRRIFFPPMGNPMGTRYFTTVIILDCEQMKMYSFCYINYYLF
jgi:hypothetical protein